MVGLYAYYGINGLFKELNNLRYYVFRTIFNVYRKRSQRNKFKYKDLINILEIMPLAKPKIYQNIWIWRLYEEPIAWVAHDGFCEGQ